MGGDGGCADRQCAPSCGPNQRIFIRYGWFRVSRQKLRSFGTPEAICNPSSVLHSTDRHSRTARVPGMPSAAPPGTNPEVMSRSLSGMSEGRDRASSRPAACTNRHRNRRSVSSAIRVMALITLVALVHTVAGVSDGDMQRRANCVESE